MLCQTGNCGCRRVGKPRFMLYIAGHLISVIGWLDPTGRSRRGWRSVSQNQCRHSGSPVSCSIFFFLLLGPLGGLAADRLPRLRTLIVIHILLAVFSARLMGMAAAGVTNIAASIWPSPH